MCLCLHNLLTILYTAASIKKHLCRGLDSTCNCTLAGKNILVLFFLKAERKLILFSCFIPGTTICFTSNLQFVGQGLSASHDLRGWEVAGWVLQTCSHPNCPVTGCFLRLSSMIHLNCHQIFLFLDTHHYPKFPAHIVFVRAYEDISSDI